MFDVLRFNVRNLIGWRFVGEQFGRKIAYKFAFVVNPEISFGCHFSDFGAVQSPEMDYVFNLPRAVFVHNR